MINQHSSMDDSSDTTLIDETIRAFDQGQVASPQEGLSLITDWLSSIEDSQIAGDVIQPLTELRNELEGGAPDAVRLQEILNRLADTTEELAVTGEGDLPSRLTTLATALRNFAGQFSTVV